MINGRLKRWLSRLNSFLVESQPDESLDWDKHEKRTEFARRDVNLEAILKPVASTFRGLALERCEQVIDRYISCSASLDDLLKFIDGHISAQYQNRVAQLRGGGVAVKVELEEIAKEMADYEAEMKSHRPW